MATIYSHHADDTDYYVSLESITRNGYFPLTVMTGSTHDVTMSDDLSEVTMRLSTLLAEHAGMSRDDIIKAMEKICEFFDEGERVEVWAEDDDVPPYILVWEDED